MSSFSALRFSVILHLVSSTYFFNPIRSKLSMAFRNCQSNLQPKLNIMYVVRYEDPFDINQHKVIYSS